MNTSNYQRYVIRDGIAYEDAHKGESRLSAIASCNETQYQLRLKGNTGNHQGEFIFKIIKKEKQ